MEELLRCPFCGGDGTESNETDDASGTCFWVECGSGVCGGRTDPFFTLESAVEAWNTRTESETIKAQREVIEALSTALTATINEGLNFALSMSTVEAGQRALEQAKTLSEKI